MSEAKDSQPIDDSVQAILAGEGREDDYERLFRFYYPQLERFFRRTFGREDARDLTQECLRRVFNGIDGFKGESTFNTWVYEVARNLLRNEKRARRAQKRAAPEISLEASIESDDEGEPGGLGIAGRLAGGDPDPEERAAAAERKRHFVAAMLRLPTRMRQVVFLRYGHGLKYREIASALGIRIDTVKSQLHNARRRLQPMLANPLDPPQD